MNATCTWCRSDRLDFSEVAVWQIREALESAYAAGVRAGRKGDDGDDTPGDRDPDPGAGRPG